MNLDLLAIVPHPDDAEIGCGGLLAKAARLGQSTGIVDLTLGELSSRGNLEIRKKETAAASNVLGLAFRENLEMPDGKIDFGQSETAQAQLSQVVAAIRRHRPKILLVPYWEERHPDHYNASELITRAVFFAGVHKFDEHLELERYRPQQVLYFQMRYQFRPSFVVDISEDVTTQWKAIRCYKSQFGLNDSATNDPQTILTSPYNLQALETQQRYFGAMVSTSHGEAYVTRNTLLIRNPLKHFTNNPNEQSLIYPEKL